MTRYRVVMQLPVSFDVEAKDETDAKNRVRRVQLFPHLTVVEQWAAIKNYSIGFGDMAVAEVLEPKADSEATAS